ncbi:MAG: cation-translocating P-type ATPase [Methanobrevibacter sp.]|uniref:cation-translocating P-type ATPase n=1 Tax=Methanobrevibacter sp. TaxID=66852 RepID=UPI0025E7DBD1|nr:cation-translocating P-type ATPase [Methanobrevibacter sp.]MBQ6138874.1 cation-translocating P-type ATPase [Methanobrevibacter sp.]
MDEILKQYTTQKEGLSSAEANARLEKYGPNKLKEQKKNSPLKLFLSQFLDVLIFMLIIAAIASYMIGNHLDAIVILVVVIINSIIGFVQEYRAENAMEKLKSLVHTDAHVKRDNTLKRIPSEKLVPGDIVILEEGDKVPADIILIETYDLGVDESSLTGESTLVKKDTNYENIEDFSNKIKDIQKYSKEENIQSKLVSMNSNVIFGKGIGVVIATGMETNIGRIATMIQEDEEETPLTVKVGKLGKRIGILSIIVCIFVFFIDFFQAMDILESFMTAVSLAVAAIPEGLPAVLTLTLALGMQKMAKSNAIVKKLSSVETLGSCTYICTDKTGTLTENKMTVKKTLLTNRERSTLIAGLCNGVRYEDDELIGNPTDLASYYFALDNDFEKLKTDRNFEKEYEIPFDSNRKRMTFIYSEIDEESNDKNYYVLTKGAPEIILDLSDKLDFNGHINNFDPGTKKEIMREIDRMTKRSLRVIALAYNKIDTEEYENVLDLDNKEIEKGDSEIHRTYSKNRHHGESFEKDLIFAGLLGIMDPPRAEAIDAIADCQKAGINVVMITGDHKDTATAIAMELGILPRDYYIHEENYNNSILTGQELEDLSDDEYNEMAKDIKVYARVYPEQKRRIIEVLQNHGEIVSMTGDGVNDAPALKKASIGVAMGSGTDVTKESADMIIQDDNFATIVSSIREGRTIFDNIKRFLKFQLSTNIGAILTITIGSLLPIPTPFTPIQLLWINIIMDGPPAQSLGLEGPEKDIMRRPPEKGELINRKTMIKITISGIVMAIGTLGLFIYELNNGVGDINTKAITVAFTVFVLYQLFNALNYRSNSKDRNITLWISLIGSFILQVLVIYVPFLQTIFKTCAIGLFDWILILIISAIILVTDKIANRIIDGYI